MAGCVVDNQPGCRSSNGAFAEPNVDERRVAAELSAELATMSNWLALDGVAVETAATSPEP
jgi:uncharacterized protein